MKRKAIEIRKSIAAELHKGKKNKKNKQKEKNIIHKVAGYEYELEE